MILPTITRMNEYNIINQFAFNVDIVSAEEQRYHRHHYVSVNDRRGGNGHGSK